MRRRSFNRLLLTAPLLASAWARGHPAGRHDGVFWEITGAGVRNWLLGTLHQPDARLWPPPDDVRRRFEQSRRLVIELRQSAQAALEFFEDSEGRPADRVESLEDPVLRARVIEALGWRGHSAVAAGRLKLWAALLYLTELQAGSAGPSMDFGFYADALQARKRVVTLDSVEEQVAVFDSLPRASQVALLDAALAEQADLPTLFEETVSAYLARDIGRIARLQWRLAARRADLRPHLDILHKKVIVDRSVVMAFRMQAALRLGDAFVAVGASHLVGPAGIPALLAGEYGWRLRRLG